MADVHFFEDLLTDIVKSDEQTLIHALLVLNSMNEVRRVPLFNEMADLVYSYGDDEYLLVRFDFLPGETYEQRLAWLADEEVFHDNPPFYFSESSHRVSPVHKMRCAKELFLQLNPGAHVCVLLVCNYEIINPDDMDEYWREWGITVVHRVQDSSHSVFFPTDEDKRQNPGINKETLLPNKVTYTRDEDNDSGQQECDTDAAEAEKKNTNSEEREELGQGEWMVKNATLYSTSPSKTFTTFNHRTVETITALLSGTYSTTCLPDKHVTFNLYNELGQLLEHRIVEASFKEDDEEDYMNTMLFEVSCTFNQDKTFTWTKGRYVIEVKRANELLYPIMFTIGTRNIEGVILSEDSSRYNLDVYERLEQMVGLCEVKEQLKNFKNMYQILEQRRKYGLSVVYPPVHAVFMGNAGLGKMCVAHMYAEILYKAHILQNGRLKVISSTQLMDAYGQNNLRDALNDVQEAGGLLCIENANLLYKTDVRDPNIMTIIDMLTDAISQHRSRQWGVIFVGTYEGMMDMLGFYPALSAHIPERNYYHFKDFTEDEMLQLACAYCEKNTYILSTSAKEALTSKIQHDYRLRGKNFNYAQYIHSLFSIEIVPAMLKRMSTIPSPSLYTMLTIEKEDVPGIKVKDYRTPLKKIEELVGLKELKRSIRSHVNMVQFAILRNEQGIKTEMPPLHMVFTGNPGTGKTTMAAYLGEIYASLGLLSKGNVIYVERKDLVGQYIGETERKMVDILNRAQGNVLFIDEAYSLAPKGADGKDFGHQVVEALLSTLGKEHVDMMVVLAGYPKEMEMFMQSNPGLRSRFPYTFVFPDYTADELMQIADLIVKKSGNILSVSARKELEKLVHAKLEKKDAYWGNARFITRLISGRVITEMSNRIAAIAAKKKLTKKQLCTICKEDIQAAGRDVHVEDTSFNERAISRALNRLDALVGLEDVKQNIHNFVKVARFMHAHGHSYTDNEPLRWNFTGNTGTGKSTIAGIMGELLKAMNLLQRGHVVELRAEQLYTSTTLQAEEILQNAITKSAQGLLFIDGDAPVFKDPDSVFSGESLRFRLAAKATEVTENYALIIAENETDQHLLSRNLRKSGVAEFDHTMHFADYAEDELLAILGSCLERKKMYLSAEASKHMADYIHALCGHQKLGYANARTMSKIAHAIANAYVIRVSGDNQNDNGEIQFGDVQSFVWQEGLGKRTVGFE